jgi:hypothetical protein
MTNERAGRIAGNCQLQRKCTMATRDEIFPSKYLKAADLKGKPIVVAIASATTETLKSPEGTEATKTVLSFKGTKKVLPLNMTNWDAVADVTGEDDSVLWSGHQIEIYTTTTEMKASPSPASASGRRRRANCRRRRRRQRQSRSRKRSWSTTWTGTKFPSDPSHRHSWQSCAGCAFSFTGTPP